MKTLNQLLEIVKNLKIKVILINPIANHDFLPSVCIENFEFLKFINLNENVFRSKI